MREVDPITPQDLFRAAALVGLLAAGEARQQHMAEVVKSANGFSAAMMMIRKLSSEPRPLPSP